MTPTWPAAPGVPENAGEPLTAGYYWVNGRVMFWNAERGAWKYEDGVEVFCTSAADAARMNWNYGGPVYTAAQVEAARREEREVAAVYADIRAACGMIVDGAEIRALPTAPTPALDAVVQRAEQRVFEECAKIARRGLYVDREWLPKVPTEAEAYDSMREARAIESEIIRACAARTDRSGG